MEAYALDVGISILSEQTNTNYSLFRFKAIIIQNSGVNTILNIW